MKPTTLRITREPIMTCVHTFQPKRRTLNWRRAAKSLLMLLAVAFVAVGLPLMLFVSCTNGR